MHNAVKWMQYTVGTELHDLQHQAYIFGFLSAVQLSLQTPWKGGGSGDRGSLILNLGTEAQEQFFLGYLTPEDGTDRLSRNVGNKLSFSAA